MASYACSCTTSSFNPGCIGAWPTILPSQLPGWAGEEGTIRNRNVIDRVNDAAAASLERVYSAHQRHDDRHKQILDKEAEEEGKFVNGSSSTSVAWADGNQAQLRVSTRQCRHPQRAEVFDLPVVQHLISLADEPWTRSSLTRTLQSTTRRTWVPPYRVQAHRTPPHCPTAPQL